jgi:hypothetical protein
MKQIVMVYEALCRGPGNSKEIADEIGLPYRHVSAYLNDLNHAGVIERVGSPTQPDHESRPGRKAHGRGLQTWMVKK